jgi:hypothetical protein
VSELLATEPRSAAGPAAAPGRRGALDRLRPHWPLAVLLLIAAALRVTALVAIYPGTWFSDSNSYIISAVTGRLSTTRVDGYAFLVAPFHALGSAGALIVLQHALGLAIVVVLYALLVRRGVSRWLALLGVVPAALDAYLIVVEHAIMSETTYHVALFGALACLLWQDRLGLVAAASGGLLLGYAGIVRSVGIPLAAVVLVYLLVRRVGWKPLLAFAIGWLLVAGGYVTAFHAQHGTYGFTESGGRFLYAKVAPFADCAELGAIPAGERFLCPNPAKPLTTNEYLWGKQSPIRGLPDSADRRIRDFAKRVIRNQPVDYAHVVLRGVVHYFEPGHRIGYNDYPVGPWQFPADPRVWGYPGYRGPIRRGDPVRRAHHHITEPGPYVSAMVTRPRLGPAASRALHDYQKVGYTWGPLLAACVLVVLAALILRRGAWRLRLDAALLAAITLLAMTVSQALSVFSYRYVMIASFGLPVAAALAIAALRSPSARRPPPPSPR